MLLVARYHLILGRSVLSARMIYPANIHCVIFYHLLYGFDDLSIVVDEISKESDISQERLHGFLVHWVGNLCDGPDPV